MGIETAIIASAVVGGGASILGGVSANNQAKKQAKLIQTQTEENATEELFQGKRFMEAQKVAFAKSGVKLKGSPLLVMQETIDRSEANADRIRRAGYAEASLMKQQGRQALFSGVLGAAQAGMSAFASVGTGGSGGGKGASTSKGGGK